MCVCAFFYLWYWIIKNKKNKKNTKNKKTKNACLYLFQGSFYKEMAKHKEGLIFWSDHGVEVQTCTKVVFLNSDEKTKFLKLL